MRTKRNRLPPLATRREGTTVKPACPKCGMRVRWLRRTPRGNREVYEDAGRVFVVKYAGGHEVLVTARSWLPHQCTKTIPKDPVERAALTAEDPVVRGAFAALLEKR